jgi:DNA-binding NarL/FixJ family response regulator
VVNFRVLIVDDYAPFRRVVRLILQSRADLTIVGEASDGLEAVQQAIRLQPDLIVLDLDLPSLNGIQAARRLADLVPNAKTLFISVESSPDVVEEAMRVGVGYVHKIRASTELLPAIDMVLSGKQFVSKDIGLSTRSLAGATEVPSERDPHRPRHRRGVHHEVAFYPNEASLVAGLVRYIEVTLHRGDVIIAMATQAHRLQILEKLRARGLHLDTANDGHYVWLDSMDTLSLFLVNDWPDPLLFHRVVGDLAVATVESARQRHRRVAACGQLAPILWAKGKRNAAIEVETLWDDMCHTHGIDSLCAYVSATVDRDRHLRQFDRICAVHSAVHFR